MQETQHAEPVMMSAVRGFEFIGLYQYEVEMLQGLEEQ